MLNCEIKSETEVLTRLYWVNLAAVAAAVFSDVVIQPALLDNVEHLDSSALWLLIHVLNHTGLVGNGFFGVIVPTTVFAIGEYALEKNSASEEMQERARSITMLVFVFSIAGTVLAIYDAKETQLIVPLLFKVAKDSADIAPGLYGVVVGAITAYLLRKNVLLGSSKESRRNL